MFFCLLIGECLRAGKNFPSVGQRTLHKCSSHRYFFYELTFEYSGGFSTWLFDKNIYVCVYIYIVLCAKYQSGNLKMKLESIQAEEHCAELLTMRACSM